MTQMSGQPRASVTSTALHGDELLQVIRGGASNLPRGTLLAMALGGLRVRMMRSVVTLLSIVLAIAFLSYTGVNNKLVYRLAQVAMAQDVTDDAAVRAAEDIQRLFRANGIDANARLAEGNPMDTWLIIMAMLTCAVGITNAMLMSVTERFREIGTMKCLGAQDRLVVRLFLIESGLLGLVGAVAGIVLGLLVGLAAGWLQFGSYGLTYFPWAGSAGVIGWSVLAGVAMAVVGAVYPALVASRMKPVDALRVDE